jgi:tRNA pseudouridine32 synthase / 23S rRNA pseudouridine746 synthase
VSPEGYSIIYQDDQLLALNKASGLLSVPGIGPDKADCLASRVQAKFPGARIVHRLDRDTSGLIIMALDAESHRTLSIQFQDRHVQKTYLAIVADHVVPDEGEIDLPLRKAAMGSALQIVDHTQGRASLTRFRVLERSTWTSTGDGAPLPTTPLPPTPLPTTRLMLLPVTGRSHQLRVHAMSIGHPILGDDLYAPPAVREAAPRLMLHAWKIALGHPQSGDALAFEAPPDF